MGVVIHSDPGRFRNGERLLAHAQGFKWEAPCTRSNCQSATTMTSGAQYYTLMPVYAGEVMSGLVVDVITGGSSLSLLKVGLVGTDGTLLASSATAHASFTTSGAKAVSFSSSYTPTADGAAYAVLVCVHTGTGPNIVRMQAPVVPNAYSSNALPSGRRTGLSDIAAQVPADGTGAAYWFGVI